MSTGLEVAQTFFREWGLPYLQQNFPHLEKRAVAARDAEAPDEIGWRFYFPWLKR